MSDILHKTLTFEAKFAESGSIGVVRGMASPFYDEPDSHGDVIAQGAFLKSISQPDRIPMLWQHDQTKPVGRWRKMTETKAGLEVEGRLNLDTQAGREAYEHLRHKDISGLSIGYSVPSGGAQRLPKGGRLLKEVKLMEISFVSLPSADNARVTEVKTFNTAAELKSALRDLGLAKSAAEKITRGGWPALSNEATETGELLQSLRDMRSAAAELKEVFSK